MNMLMKVALVMVLLSVPAYAWPWSRGTTAPVAERKTTKTYGPNGTLLKEETESKATGPASKGLTDFDGGKLDLNETSITVGGTTYKVKLPRQADRLLLWVGVGFIGVGGLLFGWLMKQWVLAGVSCVLGVSIIGLAHYPWIAGVAAGLALVSGAVYLIWRAHRGRAEHNTLRALIGSVREAPDESEKAVLERFKDKAKHSRQDIVKILKSTEKRINGS